jgi:hypothetical protein
MEISTQYALLPSFLVVSKIDPSLLRAFVMTGSPLSLGGYAAVFQRIAGVPQGEFFELLERRLFRFGLLQQGGKWCFEILEVMPRIQER